MSSPLSIASARSGSAARPRSGGALGTSAAIASCTNHDAVTASDAQGRYDGGDTCNDWTTTETNEASMGGAGGFLGGLIPALYGPGVGHAWPAVSGTHWIASHAAPGCGRSASVVQTGAGSGTGIGSAGGYGGFYCFALSP